MRLLVLLPVLAATVALRLALPGTADAALPPNRDDPCSNHGRNTCGTLGVGFYDTSPAGVRWFGDYRGAVPGAAHTFCIDAGFWYASPSYGYAPVTSVGLRNRDDEPVSLKSQAQMAYAMWKFGRTTNETRQAAVMLYTHAQMGDSDPSLLDPEAVNPQVAAAYEQIDRETSRLHGPYRIETKVPARLTVDRKASVQIRVVAASGAAVPNARVQLTAAGLDRVPATVKTGSTGTAAVTITPQRVRGVQLSVQAPSLAATRPKLYAGTTTAARVNGQRLAVPSPQTVSKVFPLANVHASPTVSTHVSTQKTAPGASIVDTVDVHGLGDTSATVTAELYGPFPTRDAIRCTGTPYWTGTITANGNGTYRTPPVRLDRAGFYTYRESIARGARVDAYTSPCGEASETTLVHATPAVTTVASHEVAVPGTRIADHIEVTGLGKTPATVTVELFGPFATREGIRCDVPPVWEGPIDVAGNGSYVSPAIKVLKAGLYAFRERIAGTDVVAGMTTPCGLVVETSTIAPAILTGRGDPVRSVSASNAGGRTPVRVRVPSLGIDAPISPSGIDVEQGVLGVPGSIQRVGWWRDGAAPASSAGAILLAGHVDDRKKGIGALFDLHRVQGGATIEVTTRSGAVHRYRVTTVHSIPKRHLPPTIFSRKGDPRLVLVTCGGDFDEKTGHYPDNLMVVATPV